MNSDLKRKIKSKGIMLWQIAEKLGIHDSNFSRMLRYKLNDEQRKAIVKAISEFEREKHGR